MMIHSPYFPEIIKKHSSRHSAAESAPVCRSQQVSGVRAVAWGGEKAVPWVQTWAGLGWAGVSKRRWTATSSHVGFSVCLLTVQHCVWVSMKALWGWGPIFVLPKHFG